MPLKQADIQQVNDAIKGGNINAAKRLLRESDDPRAAAMLAKLDKKYPTQYTGTLPPPTSTSFPTAPRSVAKSLTPIQPPAKTKPSPMSSPVAVASEMDEIKTAIKDKRYDDAEALLILSNDPEAEVLRERLAAIRGGGGKAKRVYIEEEKDLTAKFQITFFLLIFLTVFGLVALGIFVPEAKKYPNAPGAGGLLLMNRVVRFILYGMLAAVVLMLILLGISYVTRPQYGY